MGVFANKIAQEQTNPSGSGLFSNARQVEQPKGSTMFQKLVENLVARPAIRVGQALVGLGVEKFGNAQQKENFLNEVNKPVKLPLGLGTVAPQKVGEGSTKQIVTEGGKSLFDAVTVGAGGVINKTLVGGLGKMGASKVVTPVANQLAKTKLGSFVAKKSPQALANITEGVGYNTGFNLLNEKKATDNIGVAGAVGLVAPPVVGSVFKGVKNVKNLIRPNKEAVDKAVDELEGRYVEWSTGTKPGKKLLNATNKKTEALNRAGTEGKTAYRGLSEKGVVPQTKGVKFDTFNQAETHRNTAVPLREANRQALQEAGLSTIPTKLDDLENRAISLARTKENINSGRAKKMEREIRNEFNLLRSEYPDGNIPLILQDEIKSARWDNVFKNKSLIDADVLKKDSEYAIAKAFQKNIEDVAEKAGQKEVAQLNREIGSILEEAKFLESLDGKVLKGGRVGKYVGTVIGSSLGQSIPGKIVGALGGNVVADILIKSSVNSPVRRIILRNLQKTDPEAYQMTIKWLEQQGLNRETRLMLPAPSGKSTINQGRPINVFPRKVEGEYIGKDIVGQSKSPTNQQTNPAIASVNKTPIPKTLPQTSKKSKLSDLPNKQGGFIQAYKGEKDLTTKFLDYAKGKTTLSRQEITDFARRPELKKGEADLLNSKVKEFEGDKLPAQDFADSIRRDLLELKPVKVKAPQYDNITIVKRTGQLERLEEADRRGLMEYGVEHVPDEALEQATKGGKNYEEVVFESPITTNGSSHFPNSKNYFAHARGDEVVEGGKKIWREQEIQSDLFAKNGLERQLQVEKRGLYDLANKPKQGGIDDLNEKIAVGENGLRTLGFKSSEFGTLTEQQVRNAVKTSDPKYLKEDQNFFAKQFKEYKKAKAEIDRFIQDRPSQVSKLSPFTNDRFGERIMRERIKEKAQKGYSKYRLPTGETIGKIEGFEANKWGEIVKNERGGYEWKQIKADQLKVGKEINLNDQDDWIITDILGEGRFKAVPKQTWDDMHAGIFLYSQEEKRLNELWGKNQTTLTTTEKAERDALFKKADQLKETFQFNREIPNQETFDLTGKSNPQYRRYENWGKFLKNKYGGKEVVDPQGNEWMEVELNKGMGKVPVEAFGKVALSPLFLGAGLGLAGVSVLGNMKDRKKLGQK